MARAPGSNDPVSYLFRRARFPVKFVLEDVWSVQCARFACHQSVHAGVLRSEQARFLPLFATMPTEVHKELPAAGATTLPTFCDPAVSCTAARRAGRAHAVCSVRVRCESNYEELTRSHFTRHSPPLQIPVLVQSISDTLPFLDPAHPVQTLYEGHQSFSASTFPPPQLNDPHSPSRIEPPHRTSPVIPSEARNPSWVSSHCAPQLAYSIPLRYSGFLTPYSEFSTAIPRSTRAFSIRLNLFAFPIL